jgi:type IV pilus assembly protein PilA
MINKLRVRAQSESGFTLVELLVVMLILGLLAAIAIPAFFNQRDKAKDSSAKEAVRTAETAIETYSTDHNGSYAGANDSAPGVGQGILAAIEPTLNNAPADSLTVDSTADDYTVTVTASTGNVFAITRDNSGSISLTCDDTDGVAPLTGTGDAGCPSGGDWGS